MSKFKEGRMIIKTFEGFTTQDVMASIKKEFGSDAMILSRKTKNRKGQTDIIEIQAAVPEPKRKGGSRADPTLHLELNPLVMEKLTGLEQQMQTLLQEVPTKRRMDLLVEEVKALQFLYLESLKKNHFAENQALPKVLHGLYEYLHLSGISLENLSQLFQILQQLKLPDEYASNPLFSMEDFYRDHAIRWLSHKILIAPKIEAEVGSCNIQVFAGASGCGKTDVMAKIAAQFYKEKSKLLLVSLENDKISSQEKLKTYSKIFGFPFLSVENLQELKALLLRERGYNLILVDAQLEIGFPASRELLDTLGEHNPAHLNLVLSMTEKEVLHDRIISQLASNSISSLIFSKLDQAWNYGHILNLCEKWKIPVSYLSLGPKVPEDLEKASREKIIERMFGL